jgi:hypothetical protein
LIVHSKLQRRAAQLDVPIDPAQQQQAGVAVNSPPLNWASSTWQLLGALNKKNGAERAAMIGELDSPDGAAVLAEQL